ncbi:MAG: hypothetical protein R2851_13590 [Caldilineaceae bacterium]
MLTAPRPGAHSVVPGRSCWTLENTPDVGAGPLLSRSTRDEGAHSGRARRAGQPPRPAALSPLAVALTAQGAGGGLLAELLRPAAADLMGGYTNRDPGSLTTLIMTGVTAMARGTAAHGAGRRRLSRGRHLGHARPRPTSLTSPTRFRSWTTAWSTTRWTTWFCAVTPAIGRRWRPSAPTSWG